MSSRPRGRSDRFGIFSLLAVLGLFLLPVMAAGNAWAEDDDGETLKKLLEEIEDLWDSVDELEDRLVVEEKRSAWDRLSFYGDFRVQYAYEHWDLPAQNNFPTFIEMMAFGAPGSGETLNTFAEVFGFLADDKLPLKPRDRRTLSNDQNWMMRLRLKMKAELHKTVHFAGRLSVKRYFGSGITDPIFNGFPNTVSYSFSSATQPSDTTLKLERAYAIWEMPFAPLVLTVGRQAASEGPPRELRENRVRQGTPPAQLIDAEIDGVMLAFKFHKIFKSLPPTTLRFCYGLGYEAGFGGGGRVEKSTANMGMFRWVSVEGLKDMTVAGGCMDTQLPFLADKTLLSLAYFRGSDLTDIPSGVTVNFPDPWGSSAQRVTATANLGDIDLFGFVVQARNFGVDWFVSVGCNIFHPNGNLSQYGFGSLGNNDPRYAEQLGSDPDEDPADSHTGYSIYTGTRIPIEALRGKLGLEYNYGSKYWFSFTQASDDVNNKIATRGHVGEAYYILDVLSNFFIRVGYQYYDYKYSLSGWHIGAPTRIKAGGNYFYPTPQQIHNVYALLDFKF